VAVVAEQLPEVTAMEWAKAEEVARLVADLQAELREVAGGVAQAVELLQAGAPARAAVAQLAVVQWAVARAGRFGVQLARLTELPQ